MEKSNIEILQEFAKSTDRQIKFEEIAYPKTGFGTIQKYKRVIYIPNNMEKTSFFIWYSDPYARIGYPTIFSGAFIPLPSECKSSVSIRKKYFIDKLNILSKSRFNGVGNSSFDSKVILSNGLDNPLKRILSKTRIQKQILEALDYKKNSQISINENNIDFVKEFDGVPYLSIINPIAWDLEGKDIERIFRQAEKINAIIER